MKVLLVVILFISLSGCYSTLHYGYLPGGDYKYYAPLAPVDLQGQRFRLEVIDARRGFHITCWDAQIDRNTELEGATGYDFFSAYMRAMIEANHGLVDPKAERVIKIELTGLSVHYQGFGYVHVYGLVEFNAVVEGFHKNYCSAMVDGEKDAPVGKYALDTRKGALRKMVSGSARRALEAFVHDLATLLEKERQRKSNRQVIEGTFLAQIKSVRKWGRLYFLENSV